MGGVISIYVEDKYMSVLLIVILFVSNVIEICNVKITIGYESTFVIGIYRPPDRDKLPQFDEIQSDILTKFDAKDCCFLIDDVIWIP